MSPQQTDVIEHHYRVYERLQKIRAETEEVGALNVVTVLFICLGVCEETHICKFVNFIEKLK